MALPASSTTALQAKEQEEASCNYIDTRGKKRRTETPILTPSSSPPESSSSSPSCSEVNSESEDGDSPYHTPRHTRHHDRIATIPTQTSTPLSPPRYLQAPVVIQQSEAGVDLSTFLRNFIVVSHSNI
eukprot:TRINITY_DN5113_c0_g1_i3.p1 TRINITY_DN5113_c0_g1~~TRINITY_DN5113_c0_g1_i3.p1  ORF type:complete len:128 (+),score=36.21 TRINITY_DN5113_c0_g1_i3:204-587(+)